MNLFHETYQHKSLITAFALTDLKLRYRNSILGFLWSILEPLLMLSVLYIIFNYVFKSQIENYGIYLLLGIILWQFFARGTTMSSNSILARGGLVLTTYFPRIILPISSTLTAFLMLLLEFLVFAAFVIALQFVPSYTILLLPIVIIPLFILTMGMSLMMSTINVMYRDVGYIWAVVLQAGFFATPIIYKIDIFPEEIQKILFLNPLAHYITWAHDLVLFDTYPSIQSITYGYGFAIGVLIIGILLFYKTDKKMIDKL